MATSKMAIITNKYFLATAFFVIWMIFFDEKDIFSTVDKQKELKTLLAKKQYYLTEIEAAQKELTDFQNNTKAVERLAREKYMLKRDGEDLYIIEDTLTNKTSIKQ